MKKIAAILLIAILATSCKKDDTPIIYNDLNGEWEFVYYGGFGIPYTPGPGKILSFENGREFERRSYDTVLHRGTYSLEKRKDCFGSEEHLFINTSDDLFMNGFKLEIQNDSLFISHPNCLADGGISIYRKL